ncbi:MAG: membrane protein insertion efficiency factor YidD [Clostridia bacterium]|nr:membrane protein insertion efficiency factor YidD [Clostridia bacterium]
MKRLAMALIRFYRRHLSKLKPAPTCRFTPTCSAYALEAFEKRGFFAGMALTLWRILRCSPLSPAGYDPLPQAGFKTMPLRWSKYDKYRAEQEVAAEESRDGDPTECGPVSPDDPDDAPEDSSSDGHA